jgi:hypothetical protein
MNQVTRRRLKRLEMDDYDLGHLDNRSGFPLIATIRRRRPA